MKRNAHTPDEKAKMVLEVLRGERTINEIASEHGVHPYMLSRWKREAESNLYVLFQDNAAKKRKEEKAHEEELQALYARIGQLTTQNEWLKKMQSKTWSSSLAMAIISRNAGRLSALLPEMPSS